MLAPEVIRQMPTRDQRRHAAGPAAPGGSSTDPTAGSTAGSSTGSSTGSSAGSNAGTGTSAAQAVDQLARPAAKTGVRWDEYRSPGFFDEMLVGGGARGACAGVVGYLAALGDDLLERQRAAELAIKAMG